MGRATPARKAEADGHLRSRRAATGIVLMFRKQLTREQYNVARMHGTERAFSHPYNNEKRSGIYRCLCCGEPLFHSETKFDSRTGWPSYYAPIDEAAVAEHEDNSLFTRLWMFVHVGTLAEKTVSKITVTAHPRRSKPARARLISSCAGRPRRGARTNCRPRVFCGVCGVLESVDFHESREFGKDSTMPNF